MKVGMEVDVVVGMAEEKHEPSEVVRWERLLPRLVLRVLLVEADDSTRQIIAAHLRKCNYKVVAAVSDGLTAWETLKDRPHSIDLILTEVDLPSISGFALLSLIMEHDFCKSIPVIMMSSHDSINTVLKCMLKGAADFLIKPVRRNELRNLWQHVWRRHALADEHLPPSLPATENRFEATAENDALCNQWQNDGSSIQKNNEANQMKCANGTLTDFSTQKQGNIVRLGRELLQNEGQSEENSNRLIKAKEFAHCDEDCEPNPSKLNESAAVVQGLTQNDAAGLQSNRGNVDVTVRVGCSDELDENPTGAIDFIGSFNKQPKGTFPLSSFSDSADKVESSPQLDLSLRRSCFSSGKNQGTTERHMLNHSDASAFSWYKDSKPLQPIFPTLASNRAAMKEGDCKSGQQLECSNDTFQPHVIRSDRMEILPTPATGQSKLEFRNTQFGHTPVRGGRMHDMYAACKNVFPQVDNVRTDLPPEWRPKPAGQRECSPLAATTSVHSNLEFNDSEQGYHQNGEATDCSIDQTVKEQNKQEPVGELSCSSPIADQSACSSLSNGDGNHENSSTHGGVSSRNDASDSASFAAAIDRGTTTESIEYSNFFGHDGSKGMDTLRSSQREAALTKFRLKRKDRCFEKKVRYQSRKRLAEQRPRVKGQFVRQAQNDTP